jgi:hypothetical protein
MLRIGRLIIPDDEPPKSPSLSIVERFKMKYFEYQIKRCNKQAAKYGTASDGVYQILWMAAVSKRSSYSYRIQALQLGAEIRAVKKSRLGGY